MTMTSPLRTSTLFLAALVTSLLLAGCNLPSASPSLATATVGAAPTPTALIVQDTLTSPLPSATALPSPSPTPEPDKLVFAGGATAGVATGSLQSGQMKSFSVYASQGQPMILILASPRNDLVLGVFNPDGSTLLDPAQKWNHWQWLLPKSGAYSIQVLGAVGPEDYTLTVKIAASLTFASGSDTVSQSGKTVGGQVVSYALYCSGAQTMTASLNVPASIAYLDVFGLAYGPLLSSSSKASSWSGVLPDTEDYVVEVIPTHGDEIGYQLSINCH